MRSKRGWIKILEAFIAILLVAGVILIVVQKGYLNLGDDSEDIYKKQNAVLREIQINDELRLAILNISKDDLPKEAPNSVESFINNKMPGNLDCTGRICKPDEICSLSSSPSDKEVYSKVVSINAEASDPTKAEYSPRKLVMFCWKE